MLTVNNYAIGLSPFLFFGKQKDGDVDKGSNRDTPGDSGGARPPRKEEYKDSERKKDDDDDENNSGQEVDNEEKDKNKQANKKD
jgi:hypothetical protein